jgi:hypothetical protein
MWTGQGNEGFRGICLLLESATCEVLILARRSIHNRASCLNPASQVLTLASCLQESGSSRNTESIIWGKLPLFTHDHVQCSASMFNVYVQCLYYVQCSVFSVSVVQWFSGSVVQWFSGSVVQWFSGSVFSVQCSCSYVYLESKSTIPATASEWSNSGPKGYRVSRGQGDPWTRG